MMILFLKTLGGGQPSVLQQVTVQVIPNSECKQKYGSDAPGGIIDSFLCAAYPGKDSCSVRFQSDIGLNCNL
jgi:secreted trypsin-like serine protease